ncbi:nucleoside-diphosphate-sugar epimerase [Motilibacter rhizosphaerae]|uniref:Nucleoside-diphosphate-sugar epimerase n=1 Tax=Motilibacter rhizosphaerae TaxID=598652 RepID=A0A4Q7NQM9_9ACTN|nr:SDR family oxidoreductase [Motilibacter rhizosphaerae]RZS87408.1 nucleoside-diphosphate-sugar epimerase [Motilibacter rhizosphaerae]
MRILVTGTEGYLGCLLAPELDRRGHDVRGLDTGFFKYGWLYRGTDRSVATIDKDIRHVTVDDLRGFDAVVHMAELSNDPLGDLIGEITYDINHKGTLRLATLAKEAGVERFVFMSSCSVYGVAEGTVDETSPINPQTAYAVCKGLIERDVTKLADDSFSPTFMRNATAFGASPRMRFDIVLNNLSGLAHTTGQIAMTSDGTPWRPLVHALDIGKAIRCVLEAPREAVHNEVFNVGSNEQNYQVRDIAEKVAAAFPGCTTSFGEPGADNRSYKVNFDKIYSQLPGFSCDWDADKGAAQLAEVFARIDLDEATFKGRGHTRLKQLEHLLATKQIDADLFWTAP